MASIKNKITSLNEAEGRTKHPSAYDEEPTEIIDEIVTYEVSKHQEQVHEEHGRCSSSSDSHENSDSGEDDFNKSDSNESEMCETICEIVTYEASVDSNAEDQETIYETVTYEITEKVKDKGVESLYKAVDEFIEKKNEKPDTDTEEVERIDDVMEPELESKSISEGILHLERDSFEVEPELELEPESKSVSGDILQLDKDSIEGQISDSEDDANENSEDLFKVSSLSKLTLTPENQSPREKPGFNKQFMDSPRDIISQQITEEFTASLADQSEDNLSEATSTTAPFEDSTQKTLTSEFIPIKDGEKLDNNNSSEKSETDQEVANLNDTIEEELDNFDKVEDPSAKNNGKSKTPEEQPRTAEIYYKHRPDLQKDIIRDKCRHYQIDAKVDWDSHDSDILHFYEMYIPDEATHGDVIVTPQKYLRSMEVYFVNCVLIELDEQTKREKNHEYNYKLVRRLCQEDLGGSGYCCVPKEITNKLQDPIRFYENSLTFDNYDEIDFAGIDIDTQVHQDLIRTFTGGKPVDFSRKCFWFFEYNEWDSCSGMFVWCDFFLDDFEEGRYIKLTPEIDDEYISSSPKPRRDPLIVKYANEIRSKYEVSFTDSFQTMKPGTEVECYGLTFFCPKNEEPNGGAMALMYFKRCETNANGKITEIVLSAEPTTTEGEEFKFTTKVVTAYGRYGGVKLWYIEKAVLPGEDAPNTYIICNSDIFY